MGKKKDIPVIDGFEITGMAAEGHIACIAKLNKLRFQRDDMNRDIDTAVSLGLPRDYINQSLNE